MSSEACTTYAGVVDGQVFVFVARFGGLSLCAPSSCLHSDADGVDGQDQTANEPELMLAYAGSGAVVSG